MFITKKHLSRRTVLKAAGVSLSLPLLDAMIPAGTALAQTAAQGKLRAGFFYIPHGAIMWNTPYGKDMDHWTPTGAGADFKLSPILKPLENYKKYVTTFGNLENKLPQGSVHTIVPGTWLSSVKPDQKATGAHMAQTIDQMIAEKIGGDAIKDLLRRTDIESVAAELRVAAKAENSAQKKQEILKRLRVVEAFREREAGMLNRPEWMVLDVIPVIPRVDVTVGTMLGGGSMKVAMNRDDGTGKVWGDLWSEYGSSQPATEYTRTLDGTFFFYEPTVAVEVALTRWLGVRGAGGWGTYSGSTGLLWRRTRSTAPRSEKCCRRRSACPA